MKYEEKYNELLNAIKKLQEANKSHYHEFGK